jgi:hypothetical protein
VPPHSNVRPSGLGSSCDGEKSALALSLQRRFCRLPPTGAAVWFHTHNLCARTYSRHKFWIVWAVRSYLLHLVQRHLCDV